MDDDRTIYKCIHYDECWGVFISELFDSIGNHKLVVSESEPATWCKYKNELGHDPVCKVLKG